jgi:hypothetical protein
MAFLRRTLSAFLIAGFATVSSVCAQSDHAAAALVPGIYSVYARGTHGERGKLLATAHVSKPTGPAGAHADLKVEIVSTDKLRSEYELKRTNDMPLAKHGFAPQYRNPVTAMISVVAFVPNFSNPGRGSAFDAYFAVTEDQPLDQRSIRQTWVLQQDVQARQ